MIHLVFVKTLAGVDRSDVCGGLRQGRLRPSFNPRDQTINAECNKLIIERPGRHKATSWSRRVIDTMRGAANTLEHTATCRLEVRHLGEDFRCSSPSEPITRVGPPYSKPMLHLFVNDCAAGSRPLGSSYLSACSTASSILSVFSTNSNRSRIADAFRATYDLTVSFSISFLKYPFGHEQVQQFKF